jgi:hypothetical protein
LISQFGLVGAACSGLLTRILNTSQHYWYFCRDVGPIHLSREIVKIAPAVLLAIACLLLLPIHFLSLSAALLTYMCIAFFPRDPFSLRLRKLGKKRVPSSCNPGCMVHPETAQKCPPQRVL